MRLILFHVEKLFLTKDSSNEEQCSGAVKGVNADNRILYLSPQDLRAKQSVITTCILWQVQHKETTYKYWTHYKEN